jgi:hypothetical protein
LARLRWSLRRASSGLDPADALFAARAVALGLGGVAADDKAPRASPSPTLTSLTRKLSRGVR